MTENHNNYSNYNKKKGILFDLDGTLWDSSIPVVEAFNIVLAKQPDIERQITLQDMQSWMGLPMDEIGRRLLGGCGISEERIREIMRACETYEIEYLLQRGGVPYPDLEEVLKELSQKYFLAIVSNCQKGYIEAFLDFYHLNEYIKDKESFGGTGLSKGENIRLVCGRNHLDKAIYLGDIEGDYRSACMAGIPFVHAAYGFGTISDPVPAIHSLRELPEIAGKLLSGS